MGATKLRFELADECHCNPVVTVLSPGKAAAKTDTEKMVIRDEVLVHIERYVVEVPYAVKFC